MIQHGGVHVAHGVAADQDDDHLENVDDLGGEEVPAVVGLGVPQVDERGAQQAGHQGQAHPQRQEGVDKQEGVQAVEESVGHEFLQFPSKKKSVVNRAVDLDQHSFDMLIQILIQNSDPVP